MTVPDWSSFALEREYAQEPMHLFAQDQTERERRFLNELTQRFVVRPFGFLQRLEIVWEPPLPNMDAARPHEFFIASPVDALVVPIVRGVRDPLTQKVAG